MKPGDALIIKSWGSLSHGVTLRAVAPIKTSSTTADAVAIKTGVSAEVVVPVQHLIDALECFKR